VFLIYLSSFIAPIIEDCIHAQVCVRESIVNFFIQRESFLLMDVFLVPSKQNLRH
jgi:hypothetical protein